MVRRAWRGCGLSQPLPVLLESEVVPFDGSTFLSGCQHRFCYGYDQASCEFDFVENVLQQQLGEPAVGSGTKLELLRG